MCYTLFMREFASRRRVVAVSLAIAMIVVVAAVFLVNHDNAGNASTSRRALARLAVVAISGGSHRTDHFHVHLDAAALRVASRAIKDEYLSRDCTDARQLFVMPVRLKNVTIDEAGMCSAVVADQHQEGLLWFVRSSERKVRNCDDSGGVGAGGNYVVETSECLQFKVVGRRDGAYPWELIQLQLVRVGGTWRIASESQEVLKGDGGRQLWTRRDEGMR